MIKASKEQMQGLSVADVLLEAGVPVFIALPSMRNGEWLPQGGAGSDKATRTTRGCGYWMPDKWQQTTVDADVTRLWRPGQALCAVMGHIVDGIDVDPRHKGHKSAKKLRKSGAYPESLGRQRTPSDGWHDLIATLNLHSKDDLMPGIDYKAGSRDGEGRGFLFIAPTVKWSKTLLKPAAYRWESPPTLAGLVP